MRRVRQCLAHLAAFARSRPLLTIFLVLSFWLTLLSWWTWYSNHDQNRRLEVRIQQERAATAWRNCKDQNARHDNTIRKLDKILARVPADRRARAQSARQANVELINALAPKRNCLAVVRRTVPSAPVTAQR